MRFAESCRSRVPWDVVTTEGFEGPCFARELLAGNRRWLREEFDLTHGKRARRVGIHRNYLSRLEVTAFNISVDVLSAVSRGLPCRGRPVVQGPGDELRRRLGFQFGRRAHQDA